MVDWCGLPEGVLALIARRLQLIEVFVAFRATCSSWRNETTFLDFDKTWSCPKLPLLIHDTFDLYEDEDEDDEYELASIEIYPYSSLIQRYWKPGNETWTRVEIPYCVEDLNYYNGKFYALTYNAEVWMCDLSGPKPDNKASKITELPWRPASRPKAQIVECGGRLLIVAPFYDRHNDTPYKHDLEMVEIDVIKGSYKIMTTLGSSAVFLGRNQGFSIDADRFQGIIQPNLIHFSDGFPRNAAPGPPRDEVPHSFCRGIWLNF